MPASSSYRSRVGLSIDVTPEREILAFIQLAEQIGVEQLWLTQISESADALTMLAAGFATTERIRLGTSIVPIYPLHPLALAQQAASVGILAGGRLRLGVGPSTRSRVKRVYGLDMVSPLAYLGEYVSVLRAVLQQGGVDFHGQFLTAQVAMTNGAAGVPVLTSALGEEAFRLAGAQSDGAISWNCPPAYLHSVAIPALRTAAAEAGRTVPPLVAHICVALTTDETAALAAGREHLSFYVRTPFYAAMFAAAGHPIDGDAVVPDGLIRDLVLFGDEAAVADQLRSLLDSGLDELLISNLPVEDRQADDRRMLHLIANL